MTTDGWDERTEAIPGTKGDKSFELDVDFARDPAEPTTEPVRLPSLVVFEPTPIGLAVALSAMGYAVRSGATGVDVMGLVSGQVPTAVICAPSPDSERRRLLAAALRLRFPAIPVLYVSTHAGQEEAVLGAIREGARAVIAWPLPNGPEVARVLAPYVNTQPVPPASGGVDDEESAVTPRRPAPRPATIPDGPSTKPFMRAPATHAPKPPASSDEFDEARTVVTDRPPDSRGRPSRVELPINAVPARKNAPAPVLSHKSEEPITQPGLRPAPQAALEAQSEKRGEIGQLLAAISPFLWSLEDAARWADALADAGDPSAKNHARALHLLAKILAQLQARIDDSGA